MYQRILSYSQEERAIWHVTKGTSNKVKSKFLQGQTSVNVIHPKLKYSCKIRNSGANTVVNVAYWCRYDCEPFLSAEAVGSVGAAVCAVTWRYVGYRQVTPLARVEYEMVDNRKGKYLLVGFSIFKIDPLQRVDSSWSIHFVEHTNPMFKKRQNLNLSRLYPVKRSDQISRSIL